MKLTQLNISARLACAFGLILLMLLGLGGMGAWQAGHINASVEHYGVFTTPSLQSVRDWKESLTRHRLLEARHIFASSNVEMAKLETEITEVTALLKTQLAAYERLLENDSDRTMWQLAQTSTAAYLANWETLKALSRQTVTDPSKTAEANALFLGSAETAYAAASQSFDRAWAFNVALAETSASESAKTYRQAVTTVIVTLTVAMLSGVAIWWWLSRSITRPLNQAVKVAERVAEGDLSSHIDVTSRDETGQLLSALQNMQQNLTQTVSDVRQNAESVATASAEIASGNNDLSSRTEQQASALEETAASMEQLSGTVRQNADNARQA
ncbi:MAG: HAMP domain-containing protein, partial [Pseudomonadota bacterium]|nr:HAMP domain-containing protein [Pseudomonadota bacterium]